MTLNSQATLKATELYILKLVKYTECKLDNLTCVRKKKIEGQRWKDAQICVSVKTNLLCHPFPIPPLTASAWRDLAQPGQLRLHFPGPFAAKRGHVTKF